MWSKSPKFALKNNEFTPHNFEGTLPELRILMSDSILVAARTAHMKAGSYVYNYTSTWLLQKM